MMSQPVQDSVSVLLIELEARKVDTRETGGQCVRSLFDEDVVLVQESI